MDRKYAEVKEGIIRNNSLWDKLIFNKVQVLIRSRKNCPGSDLLSVNFAPPPALSCRRLWVGGCG